MITSETKVYTADLHGHSRVGSDGLSNPHEIVAAAARKGLHILGWSDHDPIQAYGVRGWAEFFKAITQHNENSDAPILGIPGIERTTKDIETRKKLSCTHLFSRQGRPP